MSDLLNQASLVMVPSGYKEDTVFSVVPTDGSGDLTFTRASNGTRVNSAGLVEVVPWNLATYSENFSAVYSGINASISNNTTSAPNATTTADSLLETTATDIHAITTDYTQQSGVQYTYSVYVKSISGRNVRISGSSGFAGTIALVDLSNGSLLSGSTGASVESVGNGWYRISLTATTTTTTVRVIIYSMNGTATTFAGSTSNGVYLWGAQLNIGSTAKPYFPTTDRLNVPRLTYQNGGGGCPSLLLEKQSTNLQIYSEQFDLWSNTSDLTVSANASTSPDGTQNADKLNENSSNAYHIIGDANITLSASTIYTTSFFAKASERSYARMLAPAGNYSTESAYFDLTNGNCSASAGTVSTQSMGNGWYRCIWSLTTSSSVSGGIGMWFGPARNMTDAYNTYTGTNGSGIYAYGAQIEQSSYPTSYIPTTSSSATRVADACFKTGISSLIGQTEGTLFCDIVPTDVSGQGRFMNVLNSTDVINGWIAIISSGSNTFRFYGDGFDFSGGACLFGVRAKVALAYKNGVVTSAYVNGTSVNTLTAVTTSKSYNQLSLGEGPFGNNGSCNVNQAVIFSTALTNSELASITTI